jgi:N-acyl-D-aspartate/D-glutamate deacylase
MEPFRQRAEIGQANTSVPLKKRDRKSNRKAVTAVGVRGNLASKDGAVQGQIRGHRRIRKIPYAK